MEHTCVDLFCGGGGAHRGLEMAGLRGLLAFDDRQVCLESIAANWPVTITANVDLSVIPVATALRMHGISHRYSGLLWDSFPCQAFSAAGKKKPLADPRSRLAFSLADICTYAPGAWAVGENVPGIMSGEAKPIFDNLIEMIIATGRTPKIWLLCALDWGLAQTRQRIFIICPPRGLRAPTQPVGPCVGQEPRTLFEAIHPSTGFIDIDPQRIPLRLNENILYVDIPPSGNWADSWRGRMYALDKFLRARSEGRMTCDQPWKMPIYRNLLRRLAWDEPGPTVVATWPSNIGFRCHCPHPDDCRYLSNGECRELQGFPKHHLLAGDVVERRRQIGNAVPPPLARAVAEVIIAYSEKIGS